MVWLVQSGVGAKRFVRGRFLLAAGLAFTFGSVGRAENKVEITLTEALQIAQKESADMHATQADVLLALAQTRVANTWANPVLTASTAHIATDGAGNAAGMGNRFFDRSYDSIFGLAQLIETAGKRSLRRSAANAGVRSARAELADVSRQLTEAVSRAYIAAVEAKQEAFTIAQSAHALREEASIAAHRLRAGDISSADKTRLEIGAGQRDLDAAAAETSAKAAVVTLEILLGRPHPDGATELSDSLDKLVPDLATLKDLSTSGSRPDIIAAELSLQKAEIELREQGRERVPDVTVGVQYERNPPDLNNTLGVSVSVPLPIFDHNSGGIESARAARQLAEARLDKILIQAAADVTKSRQALQEAFSRSQRYRQELAPKSANVLATIEFSYRRGGNSLVELLDAERDDHEIRVAMLRAQADYAEAAVSLLSALNRLHPESS